MLVVKEHTRTSDEGVEKFCLLMVRRVPWQKKSHTERTELTRSFPNYSWQMKNSHMGSVIKSIALISSLAKHADILVQAVLVPGVFPLIAPLGRALRAMTSWLSQATKFKL